MSKVLMIQGTGSGVGKSLMVAGLCRIFRDKGIKVAPFKAQNMALNSFITKEGGEIGRAQAFQAEAAGIEPSINMNPILLKATGEAECQVIINGKVHSNMRAQEYYSFKNEAWESVTQAYEKLSSQFDLIIIEGAGSPAEINLMNDEIVNMKIARYVNAPVILVGDIDKGGVFASFYGTVELLKDSSNPPTPPLVKGGEGGLCDADYIRAFIINKFRGDLFILKPGLKMIFEKTGIPVIGVIPYLGDLRLHEEDGIPLERIKGQRFKDARLKTVVLRLRYISNFTDFDPFMYEPDVDLVYSLRDSDIENADLIIIPGSKNTLKDLLFLRENDIEKSIKRAVKKGTSLIGICGGYQMLGREIYDPYGIESDCREVDGLGLLDIETSLEGVKVTCQVEAELVKSLELGVKSNKAFELPSQSLIKGYEIHMGVSTGDIGLFRIKRFSSNSKLRTLNPELIMDGSQKGNVLGTYVHGIFDNNTFRRNLINFLRLKKGLQPLEKTIDYSKLRDDSLNRWAGIIRDSIDMKYIEGMIDG